MSLVDAVRKAGAELEADGVIVGFVYRYRERVGYNYAAEKPASIFFEIQLFRSNDGALVWKGIFDKTQTSLWKICSVHPISSRMEGDGLRQKSWQHKGWKTL